MDRLLEGAGLGRPGGRGLFCCQGQEEGPGLGGRGGRGRGVVEYWTKNNGGGGPGGGGGRAGGKGAGLRRWTCSLTRLSLAGAGRRRSTTPRNRKERTMKSAN